jgi:RND family efflux transporter MFP subunit
MKHLLLLLLLSALAACQTHPHDDAHDHGAAHGHAAAHGHDEAQASGEERPDLVFTHWTESSELFVELPALVRGRESPCAAHVTKLIDFSALSEGVVTVVLRGEAGDERFESRAPSVPGIFRPVAKPAGTGKRRLIFEVRAEGFSADHDLGEVMVFESAQAAGKAIAEQEEPPGRISFLKEQQWPIAFGTGVVAERPMRPTLQVTGTTAPRPDGEVLVVAPVAGRVASASGGFPRLGARVDANDLLAVLAPRLEAADLASLDLAVASAALELRASERERERLAALQTEGAVSAKRAQEAADAADVARESLASAQRRLAQFRSVQQPAGKADGAVQLRAPLSGTVTELLVGPGAFVEAGRPLIRVTDLTQIWVEAHVPAVDAGKLGSIQGAFLLVEGRDEPVTLGAEALVTVGSHVDPATGTLPVVFSLENATDRLPIGAVLRVQLITGDARTALAVPTSAIVDDGGLSVVFVQVDGEAFERRIVRLDAREQGQVEVISGLRAGEHVVTRGAWSVKLAASSGSIPAHGHAH